jgi:hypothetical protein
MKICRNCGNSWPAKIKRNDGTYKYLYKRTLCPKCSEAHTEAVTNRITNRAKSQPNLGTDARRNGIPSELLFAAKCSAKGYHIALPYGDSCQYDVIVDTGESLHRVQVKSSKEGNFKFSKGRVGGFDFLACHNKTDDNWYMLPIKEILGYSNIRVSPNGKYNKFKDFWF